MCIIMNSMCVCVFMYFIGRLTASLSRFFLFFFHTSPRLHQWFYLYFFFYGLFFGSFLWWKKQKHKTHWKKNVSNTALNFCWFFQELLFIEQWIIQFLLWLLLLYKSRFPTTSSQCQILFFFVLQIFTLLLLFLPLFASCFMNNTRINTRNHQTKKTIEKSGNFIQFAILILDNLH